VLPVVESFAPELLLVSAGFDASARDPLAQMELSPNAYGWMARALARLADRSAAGRMALVLEGGYDLVALEAGLGAAVDGMLSGHADDIQGAPDDDRGVALAAAQAGRVWKGVS
jgi:acetoin utilization deacetylase AcuC-like enzyme